MPLKMKKVQKYGEKLEYHKVEFHILIKMKTGGQLERQDLVDLILKFFTGLVILNFHQQKVM
jgi:hypothetical protein